jgi:CRP/FNR family transcriptional regulator, cyclic AMP receptor protein
VAGREPPPTCLHDCRSALRVAASSRIQSLGRVRSLTRRSSELATIDPVKMLSGVPIFEGLTKKELKAIADAAKQVTHAAGSTLAREGESGVGFFLILEGVASVTVGDRSRGKLGPGDFFGEISLLDQGPRTATVVAQTPVTTLGLTAWSFKRLVEQNPSIASKMLKVMANRLRASSRDLTH